MAAAVLGVLLLPAMVLAVRTGGGTVRHRRLQQRGGAVRPGSAGLRLDRPSWPTTTCGSTQASWTHTKSDLPTLGPYDSTDPAVIAQHVAWAKASGVDAFIASWKNTPQLDKALAELVAECHRQGLKLVLIYEGLDVNRNPIPVATVGADMAWFLQTTTAPIPSSTCSASRRSSGRAAGSSRTPQIAGGPSRRSAPRPSCCCSAPKRTAPPTRLEPACSTATPTTGPRATRSRRPATRSASTDLAAAVHADARAVARAGDGRLRRPSTAGRRVVDRRDGATLTAAWADASRPRPDGIAVISWNEFTESLVRRAERSLRLPLSAGPGRPDGRARTDRRDSCRRASDSPAPAASPSSTPSSTPAPPAASAGPKYGAATGRGAAAVRGLGIARWWRCW